MKESKESKDSAQQVCPLRCHLSEETVLIDRYCRPADLTVETRDGVKQNPHPLQQLINLTSTVRSGNNRI